MSIRGLHTKLRRYAAQRQSASQITRVEAYLRGIEAEADEPPVLVFNASTRLGYLSLNAAFSLLTSWAIRSAGVPVKYLVCRRGMDQCLLGTNRMDLSGDPPCSLCTGFSDQLFPSDLEIPLEMEASTISKIQQELEDLSIEDMEDWHFDGLSLGEACLPSVRWALRRHHLEDDDSTRLLFRRYLSSAANLADRFEKAYEQHQPRAIVVFNGITYPEAVARMIAIRRGIPVVTHEVGLRPYSAFFSHEHATFREIRLPDGFTLDKEQETELDDYLTARAHGRFTMAGIRFWPEMEPLPDWLIEKIDAHKQSVVIFTNVIFDTSQTHANTLFSDMYEWLEVIKRAIHQHPETLFVIRAHPDEERPGKQSQQSVAQWIQGGGLENLANVVFVSSGQYMSSYELIKRAKVVAVYNSSIGLEASIMRSPVLCAGRARYTQIPTVFFPDSRDGYIKKLEEFLRVDQIPVPSEFRENARRFLYYELFQASLSFAAFVEDYPQTPGIVTLSDFDPQDLRTNPEMNIVRKGILEGSRFELPIERGEKIGKAILGGV